MRDQTNSRTATPYAAKLFFSCCLSMVIMGHITAQNSGCTDPLATNYDSLATQNDGSCLYSSAIISVETSWDLPETMIETSGLIIWDERIWTHNDDTDINLYAFDTTDVQNYEAFPLTGTVNNDWEEISQDNDYVYIGDFGNNANGNRTDLKILRIEKNSLLTSSPLIDTLHFSYSLQTDFSPAGPNNTDFDCEAFIVTTDSIYLFTKEWISQKTSIYSLPKEPGTYVAQFRDSYDLAGLVTGSTFLEDNDLIVLSGYSALLQPFLFLLYDFQPLDFFSGNKRKITVNLPFHQVEGIATEDGLSYFISNEYFSYSVITVPQKLHLIDLTAFLGHYLTDTTVNITDNEQYEYDTLVIYPNPATQILNIEYEDHLTGASYAIFDLSGRKILSGKLDPGSVTIDIGDFKPGTYLFIVEQPEYIIRKIIRN
ncbi:MAG: T9SS type A sorting domain-containing protein [Bacteroidales bacterium]|nr:T9SS type A sorting domain-containing protein [Bacteroidales bacterium]